MNSIDNKNPKNRRKSQKSSITCRRHFQKKKCAEVSRVIVEWITKGFTKRIPKGIARREIGDFKNANINKTADITKTMLETLLKNWQKNSRENISN